MRVGILGAGLIGSSLARHLLSADHAVAVYNRTQSRAAALTAAGAQLSVTPTAAASASDVLITALADGDAVLRTVEAAGPPESDAPMWLQVSTIGIAATEQCADLASALGWRFVDAPLLGSRVQAEEAALVVLASGAAADRGLVEDFCRPFSRTVVWAGDVGTGTRLKLAVNNLGLALVEATAETVALAQSFGLDVDTVLRAIDGGPFHAPIVETRARMLAAGDVPVNVRLALARKDAELIAEAATSTGVRLPLTECIVALLREAGAAGLDDEDLAATYQLLIRR